MYQFIFQHFCILSRCQREYMCQVDITLPDINRACQVEINFSEILLLTLMLSYVGVKLIDQMNGPWYEKRILILYTDNKEDQNLHVRACLDSKQNVSLHFYCWQVSNPINRNPNKYSRLSLSRIPRDSLKHFEISVLRHIRVERVRKTINWTTTFNKWICNLTHEVRNIYI